MQQLRSFDGGAGQEADPREQATILAALRHWTRTVLLNEAARIADVPEYDIATSGGELAPLKAYEVEALGDRLNGMDA